MKAVSGDGKTVSSAGIEESGAPRGRGKTAALRFKLSVQARGIIFGRTNFHDAAKFSPVFGGKAGGHHAHGFDVARFDRRRKTRGTVFGHGQTVHDELDVILRAA